MKNYYILLFLCFSTPLFSQQISVSNDQRKTYPSVIQVFINGTNAKTVTLPDDPADHRGVLSWHNQLKDKKLREGGSYGYLVKIPISKSDLAKAAKQGFLNLKIQTVGEGGLAIYGENFGRFPVNPSVVIVY